MEKDIKKSNIPFKEREKRVEKLKKFLLSNGFYEITSTDSDHIFKVEKLKAM